MEDSSKYVLILRTKCVSVSNQETEYAFCIFRMLELCLIYSLLQVDRNCKQKYNKRNHCTGGFAMYRQHSQMNRTTAAAARASACFSARENG